MALMVQSLVPVGYMPKAFADDGFAFLEFCPQGVSDEVMAIIHGDAHQEHHEFSFDADLIGEHPLVCETDPELETGLAQHHEANVSANHHQSHASEWINSCPFALASVGEDLAVFSSDFSATEFSSADQPDSIVSRIISSEFQRKNRSRAPPV